ncbi:MAG: asparagine synthase (glutamine-hydrolyzing) [Parcubacteria bacterium C7867-006]|nr:MAG: asparagine synthase (glutamine-hydrolyzing) [Parcubacteria bacterium C7867-006]
MCGIAGVIEPSIKNKEKVIEAMVSRIIHRGPDEDGFYVDKNVGLGMRRLSIIDLSTGHQPITSEDEKLLIFFNGEIYNYLELKKDLLNKKYNFKTDSDTEVILHMYEEYGENMLQMLRGMFTFCIYNTETKEVFVARDFFGIKPLYYLVQNEKIVAFSSEAKSFLSFPKFKPEVNDSAVMNYLSFQYNPLVESFFKDVYKLPPAHFMRINLESGQTEIKKYWSFDFKQNRELDEKKTKIDLLYTIKDSVRHHMIADVPVGAFLSGGIDSSIITTLMQEIRGDKKIKTFTVGFNTLTEATEAKETSDVLGTDHNEITVGPEEYFSVLGKAVYHFDEPVADPSAIGIYFLAREAAKSVKVVLSGEGSDELFGGYNIYTTPFASNKMLWLPKPIIDFAIKLPFNFFGKNYLKRVSQKIEDWYFGQKYFSDSIFDRSEIKKIWKGGEGEFLSMSPLYKKAGRLSDSTKMQYIDINTWLVGDILAKADKMTMAHSLELRVPFLDIKVAELARTLPDRFKWHNGATKYLLREAFSRVIPESTRNRRKLGFPTPIRDWMTGESIGIYNSILNNDYIKKNLDIEYIKKLIEDHNDGKKDNSRKIYTLLMLALWYDTFIK